MKPPSLWKPMTDPVHLAAMGKLIEELGEATKAAARCMIQGIDECDPGTGKSNRLALEEELADVSALMMVAGKVFDISGNPRRLEEKYEYKMEWLNMLQAEKTK